jgi:bifunctional non-homologous end joining protein LigD
VLLSWAVPKGPSLDPRQKRLAVQVGDHALDYASYEGKGHGTVMVWDRGTWEPLRDAQEDYRRGRLSFTLHGEKLKGAWHLVRAKGAEGEGAQWLLFKGADGEARRVGSIVDDAPLSVVTGRSLEEIANGEK